MVQDGDISDHLDVLPFDRSAGPVPLCAFIGGVHSAHQIGLAALVRVVDQPSRAIARRSAAASAFGGTARVSCQAGAISSSRMWMASGDVELPSVFQLVPLALQ